MVRSPLDRSSMRSSKTTQSTGLRTSWFLSLRSPRPPHLLHFLAEEVELPHHVFLVLRFGHASQSSPILCGSTNVAFQSKYVRSVVRPPRHVRVNPRRTGQAGTQTVNLLPAQQLREKKDNMVLVQLSRCTHTGFTTVEQRAGGCCTKRSGYGEDQGDPRCR